jgi:hypothetical protein
MKNTLKIFGVIVFIVILGGAVNLTAPWTSFTATSQQAGDSILAHRGSNYIRLAVPSGYTLPSQTGQSGKYLTTNGTVESWATVSGGGGTPGGSTTQLQYNNAGVFAGITGATSNGTILTLTSPAITTPTGITFPDITGTLAVNKGGTAKTTFAPGSTTANQASYTLDCTSKEFQSFEITTNQTTIGLSYSNNLTGSVSTVLLRPSSATPTLSFTGITSSNLDLFVDGAKHANGTTTVNLIGGASVRYLIQAYNWGSSVYTIYVNKTHD